MTNDEVTVFIYRRCVSCGGSGNRVESIFPCCACNGVGKVSEEVTLEELANLLTGFLRVDQAPPILPVVFGSGEQREP